MDGVYVTDDAWLAGFLLTGPGAHLGEPIVEGGQVTFQVVGPRVAEDAELFLRGQAVANVHALKSAMNLARDFISATKRRAGGGGANGGNGSGNGSGSGRVGGSGTRRGSDGGMGRRTAQA